MAFDLILGMVLVGAAIVTLIAMKWPTRRRSRPSRARREAAPAARRRATEGA